MNKVLLALSVCVFAASGCGSPAPQKDNTDMRATLTGNAPFDINKVPPQFRDKVMQMRGGGGRPGAPAQPAGSQPPGGAAEPKTGP